MSRYRPLRPHPAREVHVHSLVPTPACALQVLIVEDGTIKSFPGDFEDYRDQLVKEIAQELDED